MRRISLLDATPSAVKHSALIFLPPPSCRCIKGYLAPAAAAQPPFCIAERLGAGNERAIQTPGRTGPRRVGRRRVGKAAAGRAWRRVVSCRAVMERVVSAYRVLGDPLL